MVVVVLFFAMVNLVASVYISTSEINAAGGVIRPLYPPDLNELCRIFPDDPRCRKPPPPIPQRTSRESGERGVKQLIGYSGFFLDDIRAIVIHV